jgi:PAS domain-containing protein
VHRESLAEMCTPVIMEGTILGVIDVRCPDRDAFDPRDVVALQTAAMVAAAHIEACRLLRDMQEIKEFSEALVATMRHALMVVGPAGTIQIVNERLCRTLRIARDDLIDQPLARAFTAAVIERHGIDQALRDVIEEVQSSELQEVRIWTGEMEQVFDLRLSRVYFRGEAHVVVLMVNITRR